MLQGEGSIGGLWLLGFRLPASNRVLASFRLWGYGVHSGLVARWYVVCVWCISYRKICETIE